MQLNIPKEYKPLLDKLAESMDIYLVGGSIRDHFMSMQNKDIDIAVHKKDQDKAAKIAKQMGYTINTDGLKFGVVVAYISKEHKVDIAQFRSELYASNSRKPQVAAEDNIESDLSRRDFTINAIAINYKTGEVVDPFNGRNDIERKVLQCVGNSAERFSEDPLRMLRALRFAVKYNLDIAPATFNAIKENVGRLKIVSKERIREELLKSLGLGHGRDEYFKLLESTGLLYQIFPEFKGARQVRHDNRGHHNSEDLIEHTETVLRRNKVAEPTSEPMFNLTLMLHDIGKIKTIGKEKGKTMFIDHENVGAEIVRKRLKELKFSNQEVSYASQLIKHHMDIHRLKGHSARTKREVLTKIYMHMHENPFLVLELLQLCEADANEDYSELRNISKEMAMQEPAVRGEDIMHVEPKHRGKLMKQLRRLQLAKGWSRQELLAHVKSEYNNILAIEQKEKKDNKRKMYA